MNSMEFYLVQALGRALELSRKIRKLGMIVDKLPVGDKKAITKAKKQAKDLRKELNETIRYDIDLKNALQKHPQECGESLAENGYHVPPSEFVSFLENSLSTIDSKLKQLHK